MGTRATASSKQMYFFSASARRSPRSTSTSRSMRSSAPGGSSQPLCGADRASGPVGDRAAGNGLLVATDERSELKRELGVVAPEVERDAELANQI